MSIEGIDHGALSVSASKRSRALRGARRLRKIRRSGVLSAAAGAVALLASGPAMAAQTAEEILGQAARYTVRITSLTSIALNQDSGGSASGAGFLIDKERGWIRTNAHVATRSPVVLKVAFKDDKELPSKRLHVDPLLDVAIIRRMPGEGFPRR